MMLKSLKSLEIMHFIEEKSGFWGVMRYALVFVLAFVLGGLVAVAQVLIEVCA